MAKFVSFKVEVGFSTQCMNEKSDRSYTDGRRNWKNQRT